jgi:hypothetical protein
MPGVDETKDPDCPCDNDSVRGSEETGCTSNDNGKKERKKKKRM